MDGKPIAAYQPDWLPNLTTPNLKINDAPGLEDLCGTQTDWESTERLVRTPPSPQEVDRLSERGLRGGARSAASAGGDLLQAAALLRTLVQSASRSESHLLATLMPRCRCHIP